MPFLQSVQHRSALLAGLTVVPLFAPLVVMAPVGGRITRSGAHSGYADLLPAFLLWGIGCGQLTLAVVAAAIAMVPAERSDLASAVNNTARQADGAIGIAVAAAVAGQPGDQTRFLRGFHAVALGCLYAAAAALALTLLPGPSRRGTGAHEGPGRSECRGAARTLRVCVLTDLLPDRRWGEGFGRPLPLFAPYPSERGSHPSIPHSPTRMAAITTTGRPPPVLPRPAGRPVRRGMQQVVERRGRAISTAVTKTGGSPPPSPSAGHRCRPSAARRSRRPRTRRPPPAYGRRGRGRPENAAGTTRPRSAPMR